MIHLSSILFLFLTPISTCLLIPIDFLPSSYIHPRTPSLHTSPPESWLITRLNIHTMSTHPNPRENWQVPMNTTLDFEIVVPLLNRSAPSLTASPDLHQTFTCKAEFPKGELPHGFVLCRVDINVDGVGADVFAFGLQPYSADPDAVGREGFRPELSFTVTVQRAVWRGGVLYVVSRRVCT